MIRGNWWSESPSDTVDGSKFLWDESWGEQHSEVIAPQLFTIDLSVETPTPVPAIQATEFLVDRTIGQPVWTPGGESFIFTSWPHNDRKLGIVYCTNRQSELYICRLGQTSCPIKLAGDEKVRQFWISRPSFVVVFKVVII